jgi:hypothetical protein
VRRVRMKRTSQGACAAGMSSLRMKMSALIIVPMMLMLVMWPSLVRERPGPRIPAMHDYRYAEPFRGSEVGNKLAQACGNCHSSQTNLPWYGRIVPISWWIQSHVREGREELNFSEWTTYSPRRRRDELESICGVISTGRMPPLSYSTMHPEARLETQEKSAVCTWTTREIEHESNRIPPKEYLCPARSPMKTTERHEHASSAVTIPRGNEAQKRFGKKRSIENAPNSCGFSMTTLVR